MNHNHGTHPPASSAQVWEERYRDKQVWSGRPNETLITQTQGLTPGRALDLGCGEGGDALWLAEQGWQVTGVDVSATALARGEQEAKRRGLSITWVEADLATWQPCQTYDLVIAFFLHSPVDFPRATIYTRAAQAVKEGGRLLIVGHATAPPWSAHSHDAEDHPPRFPPASQVVEEAGIDDSWTILREGDLPRVVSGPDGQQATIYDAVVHAERLTSPAP